MKALVVVPCYNEEKRIDLSKFQRFCETTDVFDFLFVNDGSKDGTLTLLEKGCSQSKRLNFLNLEQNVGKAEAVREGVKQSLEGDFNFIGYLDADLATPLCQLHLFEKAFDNGFKVIIGSRINRLGANIERKWQRHYLGRLFATIASLVLRFPVYDTQCGAKFFEKDVCRLFSGERFISKWIFDIELFLRLRSNNLIAKDFLELPLTKWKDIDGSRLRLRDFLRAPLELIFLARKYK